jgi:hypothetical protein
MRGRQQRWLAGVLGLGLLSVPLLRFSWVRFAARANAPTLSADWTSGQFAPPAPRNRFERVIREAQRWHMRAWQAANAERYSVEAWDPAAADSLNQAAWRSELLSADRSGKLRHARLLAARAAILAGTPEERYWAALLLARLACEAGDLEAELRETRVLARLAPRSMVTRLWLRHAAEQRRTARRRDPNAAPGPGAEEKY